MWPVSRQRPAPLRLRENPQSAPPAPRSWASLLRANRRAAELALVFMVAWWGQACTRNQEESLSQAQAHARLLVDTTQRDLAEVRQGLPLGAVELAKLWTEGGDPLVEPEAARRIVTRARDKVQDLRVAKSTFFALAGLDGNVIRNDREQDRMAGKSLFSAFPEAARAANGDYVEALGSLPEAHGVKGKPDAEWVAAQGVRVDGKVKALYVTGWAWSSYASRLEFALRGQVTRELLNQRKNVPLLYVFLIVGSEVYGSPESPEVNARAIAEREPLAHLSPQGSFTTALDITGREFALGVQSASHLVPRVAIAVLRSET